MVPDSERASRHLPYSFWHWNKAKGTLLYIYWSCPLIASIWHSIQQLMGHVFEISIPMSPKLFFAGPFPTEKFKPYKKLLCYILMTAHCLIALHWKQRSPLTSVALYDRIRDVELIEKMTARIQDRLEVHNRVWELWHLQEDPP